ncbi:MAG: DUF58 domain-containing protein, partial [Deltaproteobacteria bacterium]
GGVAVSARRRRFRAPRQLRIARIGWLYLALTLGLGFAGLNTGNNLVFLACGLMLGMVVASGILSERCLRGLELERQLPASATAGQPTLIGLSIRNTKQSASFGLLVHDRATGGRCQFPLVRACEGESRAYRHTPAQRGRLELGALRVATRFPFGLFEKSLEVELPASLIVHPAPLPCALPHAPARRDGEAAAPEAGRGVDPWELRPHREGDDARAIAWGPSARAGRLLALERERSDEPFVNLSLPERAPEDAFEREVSRAAFAAAQLLARGCAVALWQGGRPLVPIGSGSPQTARILDTLALAAPWPAE